MSSHEERGTDHARFVFRNRQPVDFEHWCPAFWSGWRSLTRRFNLVCVSPTGVLVSSGSVFWSRDVAPMPYGTRGDNGTGLPPLVCYCLQPFTRPFHSYFELHKSEMLPCHLTQTTRIKHLINWKSHIKPFVSLCHMCAWPEVRNNKDFNQLAGAIIVIEFQGYCFIESFPFHSQLISDRWLRISHGEMVRPKLVKIQYKSNVKDIML